jgi:hypothetical protein
MGAEHVDRLVKRRANDSGCRNSDMARQDSGRRHIGGRLCIDHHLGCAPDPQVESGNGVSVSVVAHLEHA